METALQPRTFNKMKNESVILLVEHYPKVCPFSALYSRPPYGTIQG